MRPARRVPYGAAFLTVLLTTLLSGGCVSNRTTPYPQEWSHADSASPTACPTLAGRYRNAGELAPGTPCSGGRQQLRGEWHCDTDLSHNIAEVDANEWVELRQPDADTLVIVSSDPVVDVKELHRSHGDFSCGAHGLERTLHVGLTSMGGNDTSSAPQAVFNGVGTLFSVATAGMAGVRTLTRAFSAAPDGSLVMDVSVAQSGVAVLIPFHTRDEGFVRWMRTGPAATDSAEAAAGTAGGVARAAVPAAQFARFEFANDFWHHTRVSSVDGVDIDEHRGGGHRAAVPSGRHWIQVGTYEQSVHQSGNFNTTYGFELEAVAGHVYRLEQRPATCLAPGDVLAALNSHWVSRAPVFLVDRAPDGSEQRFTASALCVEGVAVLCGPGDAFPVVMDRLTLPCVRLNDAGRGYYGQERSVP